jgi:hypothetical protein
MGLMQSVLTKKAGLPIERWLGFFIGGKEVITAGMFVNSFFLI